MPNASRCFEFPMVTVRPSTVPATPLPVADAKFVTSDGISAPVITDGPFPEAKELLAGYRIVDVESAERAIEIAARISAAPGANGAPVSQAIEVRAVLSAPDPEM